ncbi:hypothetical protein ABZ595_07440 [Streptomyces rubradiris]|uniref:hypothetical protein n=1 Tax=Streptomyces rubradiris TaxID=285531 RepID=UPI0033FD19C9
MRALLVEERVRGVGEQFGFGWQDAPAEALVLLALRSGDRREGRVGEVRREARQSVENPALGVRDVGCVRRAQAALQIAPAAGVDEAGLRGDQGAAARVVDGSAVLVEMVGQEDQGVQKVGAVAAASEAGEECGDVMGGDGSAGQPGRGLDRGGDAAWFTVRVGRNMA